MQALRMRNIFKWILVWCNGSLFLTRELTTGMYRVIRKSLRDFRPLRYSSRDGHAEGEHVNRGRDTPSFCPTLQVLDMSTLGDAADVNPLIKFLTHTCNLLQFLSYLQVLDMYTLGDAADVNPVIKFLPLKGNVCGRNLSTRFTSAASPRVDISSTCKVGQKFGVSLPLLTCSPSAWPSRLLYRRGRKSRRDLWISLYINCNSHLRFSRVQIS